MAEKIKIAVMGFENGHCFYLYRALQREPELEIVAASFAPRARIIYETRFGREAFDRVDLYYDDEQMLREHPQIQACICGGANFRHMEEFRLCAERGIHVFSMKAPTYDMEEYEEMLRLQKEHNILVYIELEMRWKATIERMREIIAFGKLKNGVVVSLDPSYANREPEQARIFNQNLSKYPRPVQVEMQISGSKGTLYSDAYHADYVESMDPGTMKYRVEGHELTLDDQRRIFIRGFISGIRNGTDSATLSLAEHKKTMMAQNVAYDSIYSGQPVKIEY